MSGQSVRGLLIDFVLFTSKRLKIDMHGDIHERMLESTEHFIKDQDYMCCKCPESIHAVKELKDIVAKWEPFIKRLEAREQELEELINEYKNKARK